MSTGKAQMDAVIGIAKKAGAAILDEYHKTAPDEIERKADDSPLTRADTASHNLIVNELSRLTPDVPVLSEEGMETPWEQRRQWETFWCIDPMDGTKEFIKKTGQFTVNIALIRDRQPVLGVIYAPATGLLYHAEKGKGAWKAGRSVDDPAAEGSPQPAGSAEGEHSPVKEEDVTRIWSRGLDPAQIDIVASRDHAGPAVKALMEALPGCRTKSMGSSLKFCLVAEGGADAYFRDVPTFEWDTAAAQIIVEEAGGRLLTTDGHRLRYNKENLRNPALLTVGANPEFWLERITGTEERTTGTEKRSSGTEKRITSSKERARSSKERITSSEKRTTGPDKRANDTETDARS